MVYNNDMEKHYSSLKRMLCDALEEIVSRECGCETWELDVYTKLDTLLKSLHKRLIKEWKNGEHETPS